MLLKELELTQQCLMVNPKSYGSWYHRCHCMLAMTDPNWQREIQLCDVYLSRDERNFHCWDYRVFASAASNRDPADELAFTLESINVNFGNYSAWHRRSKLLPLTHPHAEHKV